MAAKCVVNQNVILYISLIFEGSLFVCLQGFKQQALAVSTDSEHRFELALQLGELKIAYQLAVEAEVCYCTLVVHPLVVTKLSCLIFFFYIY